MIITRDVDDELRFFSWLDVGLFGAFTAVFLCGLVAIGARRRREQRGAEHDNGKRAFVADHDDSSNQPRATDHSGATSEQWLSVDRSD